jgi:DNA-binding MarR family transcriptional regulator
MSRSTPDPQLMALAADVRELVSHLLRTLRARHAFPLAQASALGQLERDGVTSIGALATAAKVRPQSMAQTVRELEELGFVERSADPDDARRALISLTSSGRRSLEQQRTERDGWLAEELQQHCTPEERESIRVAMQALRRVTDPPD